MSAVHDYCLARSGRLRLRPGDSRWLIDLALARLPKTVPPDFYMWEDRWRTRLKDKLTTAVWQRYGNPVVIFILLNVVVPIVVRLVIEWYLSRKEEDDTDND